MHDSDDGVSNTVGERGAPPPASAAAAAPPAVDNPVVTLEKGRSAGAVRDELGRMQAGGRAKWARPGSSAASEGGPPSSPSAGAAEPEP